MRLAIVQTDPVFGDVRKNVASALELLDKASADLYVLPELFNTGYNFADVRELEPLAEDASGSTYRSLADFASRKRCHIVYGFAEKADRLYNSATLVGPHGLIGLYRKVHLYYRENILFDPGNLGFPVYDLPFGSLGVMICFDWIYPEAARTLALRGAQLIAHPSNLVLPYCPDAMVTRCIENRLFAATANRVGRENRGGIDLTYIGMSQVVTPGGQILARLDKESSGTAVVDIDLSAASSKRLNEYNDLLTGLRMEQYTV